MDQNTQEDTTVVNNMNQKVPDSATNKKFKCSFCEKEYATSSNLIRHQKTSKKCLSLQNKEANRYNCVDCGYKTNVKDNYNRHIQTCNERKRQEKLELDRKEKEKLDNEINMRIEIAVLKAKLEDSEKEKMELKKEARKPKIINNVTLNMQMNHSKEILQPFSEIEMNLSSIIKQYYTKNLFLKGVEGIAELIGNHIFSYDGKKYMTSYENSKTAFHKLNDTLEVIIDDKLNDLLPLISNDISKMAKKYFDEICEEVFESDNDESSDSEELESEKTNKIDEAKNSEILKAKELLTKAKSLKNQTSEERKKCVKILADSNSVSNTFLKMKNK